MSPITLTAPLQLLPATLHFAISLGAGAVAVSLYLFLGDQEAFGDDVASCAG